MVNWKSQIQDPTHYYRTDPITKGVPTIVQGSDIGDIYIGDTAKETMIFDLLFADPLIPGNSRQMLPSCIITGNTIVVGTTRGELWRSTDLGCRWELDYSFGNVSNYVTKLTLLANGDIIGGATIGGVPTIIRSNNSGYSWNLYGQTFNGEPDISFIVDCGSNVLLLGFKSLSGSTYSKNIYRSTNNGIDWAFVKELRQPLSALAYCGDNIVVAGTVAVTEAPWAIKSSDKGVTWSDSQQFTSPVVYFVGDIIQNSNSQGIILSSNDYNDDGEIYHSLDNGASWHQHVALAFNSIVKDSSGVLTGCRGLDGKLYISNDYGASFTVKDHWWRVETGSHFGRLATIQNYNRYGRWLKYTSKTLPYFDELVPTRLTYFGDGILYFMDFVSKKNYRSTDYGATWSDTGQTHTGIIDGSFNWSGMASEGGLTAVAVRAYVYNSTYYGWLMRTVNGGASWSTVWTPVQHEEIVGIVVAGGTYYAMIQGSIYGGTTRVIKSTDGTTWEDHSSNIAIGNLWYNRGRIYGAYKYSDDSCATWNNYISGPSGDVVCYLDTGSKLILGSGGWLVGTQAGTYQTATGTGGTPPNLGRTWSSLKYFSTPSTTETACTGLAMFDNGDILATTTGYRSGTFLSTDGGLTFQPTGTTEDGYSWADGIIGAVQVSANRMVGITKSGYCWEYVSP